MISLELRKEVERIILARFKGEHYHMKQVSLAISHALENAIGKETEQLQAEVASKDDRIAELEAAITNAIESLENASDYPAAGVLEQLLNKEVSDD